jgi:hypothetical protein
VLDNPKPPADPRLSAPTSLKLLSSAERGTLCEITFRRQPAPTELRSWQALAGDRAQGIAAKWPEGLPNGETIRFPVFVDSDIELPLSDEEAGRLGLGPLADFCGAYIDNAFSEIQETWIELRAGGAAGPELRITSSERAPTPTPLPPQAKSGERSWWFETSFNLPFMYTIGAEPPLDQHTMLVFPLLREKDVRSLAGWVNGKELNIQRYAYPRNRTLSCYYADLVGSSARGGDNKLVLHLDW